MSLKPKIEAIIYAAETPITLDQIAALLKESAGTEEAELKSQARAAIDELIAPDIFPIEIAHALTRAERQRRITQSEAIVLWRDVMRTVPRLEPSLPLMPRAIELSSQ